MWRAVFAAIRFRSRSTCFNNLYIPTYGPLTTTLWTRNVLVYSPEGSLICTSNIDCELPLERDSSSNCVSSLVIPLPSETILFIEAF